MTDPLAAVVERLRERLDPATTVDRITVGERVVLVELDGGKSVDSKKERDAAKEVLAGVAHRPAGDPPATDELDLERLLTAAATPAAGNADDSESATPDRLTRALGIAAVNALSAPYVEWREGDPMALLGADVDRIVTVGLFVPAFRKFEDFEVRIVEREPVDDVPSPDGVRTRTFTPEETDVAMTGADVVFVTGSAFIYGGVEPYLEAAPADATVVVIGATASFLPEPLFERGVDVVAGASVRDVDAVRAAVTRGACGTDLHDAGLDKVYAAAARPAGVRLDATEGSETTRL